MHRLKVPEPFPRARVEREQAIAEEIVSRPVGAIQIVRWRTGRKKDDAVLFVDSNVQNYHDIDDARAVSSYDIPHLLTWGGLWELPVGRGRRWLSDGPASWILGDWQLNWGLLARSGQPYTLTVGGDPANIGVSGYARPNVVGDPELSNPNAEQWFNRAAFAIPVNEFGNSERNSLRAPGFWNVNLGLQKNIPIGGDRRLDFRVQAFNVFNHINLGNPDVRIDQPTAGRITSMSGIPRQVEFGFRLTY